MRSTGESRSFRISYLLQILLLTFLLLPLVMTALFFPFMLSDIFFTGGQYGLGHLAVMLLVPLLAGGGTGWSFSATYKAKPDSPIARYLPVLAPLLVLLAVALYAYSVSKGNYNGAGWAVFAWSSPANLILNLLMALYGYGGLMPVHELSAMAGFAFGFLLRDILRREAPTGTAALFMKGVVLAAAAGCFMFLGSANKMVIEDGIAKLRYGEAGLKSELTEYDLTRMAPFRENNGLAVPDRPPGLAFADLKEMPRLDGATALYPVYAAFAQSVYKGLEEWDKGVPEADRRNHFYVSAEEYPASIIKCSTTPNAYENLMGKKADIIFVAEPSQSQLELVRAQGDEFVMTPLGSDAFVFFTHKKNSVDNLTISQIRDIYTGKTTNWRDVGGKSLSITPFQRPENSGSQTTMQNKVMKGLAMLEPTTVTQAGGMGEVISKVASYRNSKRAIGYTFMYYASSMVQDNRIKYLAVEGIKPSPETVRNGTYPFAGQFYAVTLKSNTNPQVKKLLDWMVSPEGQELVEKTGYVPANQAAVPKS